MGVVNRLFLICMLVFCQVQFAFGQNPSQTKARDDVAPNVIEFIQGEYILNTGPEPRASGWQTLPNPNIDYENATGQARGGYRSMMSRFYFDIGRVGNSPLAVHVVGMRGNFSISVNGFEVFRNFADIRDTKITWYRPFLVPISSDALRTGMNEIRIHSFSKKGVGIGKVVVGPNAALKTYHRSRYFWHITAPTATTFSLLVIGSLVFLFWLARRDEVELLWLSVASFLWFGRNHQYFAEDLPFNAAVYVPMSVTMTYFAIAGTAAFYFYFVRLAHRRLIISIMFIFGAILTAAYILLSVPSLYIYSASALVIGFAAVVALRDLARNREFERAALSLSMALLPVVAVHDVFMLLSYRGDGTATYWATYFGAVFTFAYMISFGGRTVKAFTALGRSNLILEERVAKVRAELSESEAKRQELSVSQALNDERARLMQEMHDGIGSNLTTALAVAHRQKHPDDTVQVLRRALGDLKLTVDSLEPVEGDLVALIGNLRHRMARDLEDAGIHCKWEVEDCAPLPWLDATNALHVLRIQNEAISNVLSHSDATEMTIGCVERTNNEVAGISTFISDNGNGFDMHNKARGKGLENMMARAHSLHGQLFYQSEPGRGTTVSLWLPYAR